jgi:hypothetical protein
LRANRVDTRAAYTNLPSQWRAAEIISAVGVRRGLPPRFFGALLASLIAALPFVPETPPPVPFAVPRFVGPAYLKKKKTGIHFSLCDAK